MTGQRLARQHAEQAWGSPNISYSFEPAAMLTAFSNGVVYIWSPEVETWDTLFWFAAQPGDRWQRAHDVPIEGNPSDWIEVIDTMTIVIDDVPMRRLHVEQVCDGIWVDWAGTITERLGYVTPFYFPMACSSESGIWTLRCYSDDQIDFAYGLPCTIFLSTTSILEPVLALFPNPGTTHFTLDLPPGPHTITLFDATGRMVQHQRTTDARPVIATEALPAGVYRIIVRDEQGAAMGATWVKE